MATTPDDNYGDAMRKILSQLAQVGTLPDADLEFLTQLQMIITSKLREGAAAGQQATDQGGMQGGAGMMMPGGGPQQGGPSPMGGGMPGLTPQGVNPDELRRVMGATGEAG